MSKYQADCAELQKLKTELSKRNIEYKCCDDIGGSIAMARIHFWYNDIEWSCIHGFGTYGGWGYLQDDSGLLELYKLNGNEDPIGYLTAERVLEIIEETK